MTISDKAIVLFGHGSRDPLWREPIEAVAARVTQLQPGVPVRCAYLELEQPDLATAAAQLVAEGATRITIVPMFLGTGRHAREDLPVLVEALRQAHPGVSFSLKPAVGEDSRVIDVLAGVALE
ncbi:sirohydrochlorin chelatase [Ramlibacter sp. WS9]|uniref:sirohydrochlorin chelatase n=1 Tax=Ramlibacter sp. WS9 TaxID=1882741 RepID=UPI0011448D68|nr:CbiX/SirB N-terminal domain-containing protein [Ramlibacter sp. WS9]ROZ78202.1 cobalamin biosynthesis protein CbiX [Ramlibacter sp. WS9]